MKALVYTGPKHVELRDFPDPAPVEGEALVRIEAVGICGSDMHAFLGHDERRPAPLILGHEAAGTVLSGALEGQRVTVNPLVTCGTCADCKASRDNLCRTRQIISMPPREGAFAAMLCHAGAQPFSRYRTTSRPKRQRWPNRSLVVGTLSDWPRRRYILHFLKLAC